MKHVLGRINNTDNRDTDTILGTTVTGGVQALSFEFTPANSSSDPVRLYVIFMKETPSTTNLPYCTAGSIVVDYVAGKVYVAVGSEIGGAVSSFAA